MYNYAAIIGGCHIQSDVDNAAATGSFSGSAGSGYSCVNNENCDNEVHILGSYESMRRGFRQHPTGYANVYLSVTGSSSRALILVLSSYEHVQWTLHIPRGVIISRVIIVSFGGWRFCCFNLSITLFVSEFLLEQQCCLSTRTSSYRGK